MAVNVKFFASLRDELGCSDCACELPSPNNFAGLLADLEQRFGDGAGALTANGVRVALNQALVAPESLAATQLQAGDEVAFLPPVTGG